MSPAAFATSNFHGPVFGFSTELCVQGPLLISQRNHCGDGGHDAKADVCARIEGRRHL